VIGAFVLAVLVHPWLERWLTRDSGDPAVLDRPRNMPARTGLGVATLIFYGTLWGAASADVITQLFHLRLESVIVTFQVLLFAGPVIGFVITRRVALGLQARDAEQLAHGFETGRIVRLPGGDYEEIHRSLDAETARALGTGPMTEAIPTRHGEGWRTPLDVLRVSLAHWYERDARRSAPDAALPAALPRSLAGTARRP
jgi:ubiquinol-cytochrome c reductase cytochrome b subunit